MSIDYVNMSHGTPGPPDFWLTFWPQFVATLVGAAVGAGAVLFTHYRRAKSELAQEERDLWRSRAAACRLAQFALGAQRQALALLVHTDLDLHRTNETERWWRVRFITARHTTPTVELSSVAEYLLGSDPNVLSKIYSAQAQFERAFATLDLRNGYFLEFQSAVNQKRKELPGIPLSEAVTVADPFLAARLQGLTSDLYAHIAEAITQNRSAFVALAGRLARDLPSRGLGWLDTELEILEGWEHVVSHGTTEVAGS